MFNESQRRYLISRLRYIDELLSEAAVDLEPSDRGRLFKNVKLDSSALQRKVIGDYLAEIRFTLRRFMLSQHLEDERDPPGALSSFGTAVDFAGIAAEELRPKYLRGYGEVDPESGAAAERFAADLTVLLRRIGHFLVDGQGGSLAARLAQLSAVRSEVALLQQLERIISEYGLTELRSPLGLLADRAAAPHLEIAVFGRVNAGKSSLLNWWLAQPLLPTGITPITAVPTRIRYGAALRILVRTGALRPIEISPEQLASYVTERDNPGNSRQVLEITIEIPAERLKQDVCLVDTPGLGSLATAGAAQTLEYLPRCDLGVMLIEAGAPVSPDDVGVARALIDSGSELLVALSKADQLSSVDLRQALDYVRQQLQAHVVEAISVRPISTVGAHDALASAWFEQELAPRLARQRENAAESLKRKIGVLRESVVAILESRLARSHAQHPEQAALDSALREHTAQARLDFEHSRSELMALRERFATFSASVLDTAAQALADRWLSHDDDAAETARFVSAAALQRVAEAGNAVTRMLWDLRQNLQRLLQLSRTQSIRRDVVAELPLPRERPVCELPDLEETADLDRPRWLPRWRRWMRGAARSRLKRFWLPFASPQLATHGEALYQWGVRQITELAGEFNAGVAAYEAKDRLQASPTLIGEAAQAARADLELLNSWPADASNNSCGVSPVGQPV